MGELDGIRVRPRRLYAAAVSLSALASLLSRPSEALPDPDDLTRQARALWPVTASESVQAAALALTWGFPSLTLAALPAFSDLPEVAHLRSAALLRLGRGAEVTLTPDSARAAVLQARAAWQQAGADAPRLATLARRQARAEGDAAALIAAATLHAETELHANEPRSALRSLAEGLKAIGAGLAMLGAIGAGAGIGILVGGAVQGIARNPDASDFTSGGSSSGVYAMPNPPPRSSSDTTTPCSAWIRAASSTTRCAATSKPAVSKICEPMCECSPANSSWGSASTRRTGR